MKSMKKVLVLMLSLLLVVGMFGCSKDNDGSGKSTDGIDDSTNVKIGVLVADATGAEALAFRSYYENYIQKQYNVTFMYSDELADAAAEASAIDNFIANNCKAIISFASADRPAQIRKCAENKVYYAVATGTLSDEEYDEFKDNEYYVGAIGPDLATEFQAGYDMAKFYLDQGKTKFAIFGGATPYYTDMHIYRTAGMLVAMCEAGGGTYNGASDFGSMIGKIYLLTVGSGLDTFAAFKQESQQLATVDSYTADAVAAMKSGVLNYLAGKYSASIGPIFMATLSAVQGKPIRTANGEALALSQGYWVATSAEEAEKFYAVDSSTEDPAYTRAMLDTLFGASYDDFAKFVSAYSFEEIQNLKK